MHGVVASEEQSAVAQIATAVFGGSSLGFYVVQAFTASILILAANTAYQDFPRLASILGRDRYMPSQFVNRGDRLVFSNGVIVLGLLSALMIYIFDAEPGQADPLLRRGRVHLVHAFAERHGAPLDRGGAQGRRSDEGLASLDRDQHHRRHHDVHRAARGDPVQVQGRGVALDPDHGAAGPGVLRDPSPLHVGAIASCIAASSASGVVGTNHVVLLVREVDASVAEALGYIRSLRPQSLHAIDAGSERCRRAGEPMVGVRGDADARTHRRSGPGA